MTEPAALDLTRAVLLNEVVTSVPWDHRRTIKPGSILFLIPASNLPAESRTKWWVLRVQGNADCGIVSDCAYGVGLYADDVEILS